MRPIKARFRGALMTISPLPAKVALTMLCLATTGALATQFGTVISSTPVVSSVPVTQQQCVNEPLVYQQRSGAGALIGAVTGAAIGHNFGGGAGRAVATGIGMVAGAAIGDQVEAGAYPPVTTMATRCRNVTRYENRTVGYDVVYDYRGMRRSVRMAQDPRDRIALNVDVAPMAVYDAPGYVPYEQAPPPVVYAPRPVYANPWPYVVVGGGWYGRGWRGDGEGYGHRH
jgi:uncharacterized protein YcfJ